MSLKTQARDQSLHFGIGFAITVALSFFVPIWAAALAVMTGAVIREKLQHRDKKLWQLGKGSMLDLLFWALGIGLAAGLKVFEII